MLASLNRGDALILKLTQFAPPQRVDDVVPNKGIELVEGAQSSRAMSSAAAAAMVFRSSILSSSSRMVRR